MGEKIDLSFPVGFNTLLLRYMRRSDIIEFQSVRGMVTKMLDYLTGYSFMFLLLVFPYSHINCLMEWFPNITEYKVSISNGISGFVQLCPEILLLSKSN